MHPKYFLTYTTLVVLVSINYSFAQSDSVRVTVFDGSKQLTPSTANYDKNYIRLNYYLAARGAITLGYERILHDKHSITVDMGLTYRDFIYEMLHDDDGFDFEGTDVKIGKYLEVAYKFYPYRYHNFDGEFYISPGFITRNYNLMHDVSFYDGSINRTQKVDKGYSMQEAYLKFGHVSDGWVFDDLIIDYYFGFGVRQVRSETYEIQEVRSGTQRIVPTEKIQNIPALYLGVRAGITF